MHCGSSTEITGIPGVEQVLLTVPRKMCHPCRKEQLSPIQCTAIVCSLLSLPPREFSFSFCPFSYKLNCSFALCVPPTKATFTVPQNVPLLLGFIPLRKGSQAEHQDLLSYFSPLPQALCVSPSPCLFLNFNWVSSFTLPFISLQTSTNMIFSVPANASQCLKFYL